MRLPLLLIAGLLSACGSSSSPQAPIFALGADQQAYLLSVARQTLQGQPASALPIELENLRVDGATVELFLPPEPPIAVTVRVPSLPAAFYTALTQVASDPRFAERFAPRLAEVRIKLGTIDQIASVPIPQAQGIDAFAFTIWRQTETGIDGLILEVDGQTRVQLPEAPIYGGWGVNAFEYLDGRRIAQRRLDELIAGLDPVVVGTRGLLSRFRTTSFIDAFGAPGRPLTLYRGMVPMIELDRSTFQTAMFANAEYLVRIQDGEGRFRYIYDAPTDTDPGGYSFPRHTANIYGLFLAAEQLGEPRYAAAARSALDYLLARAKIPDEAPDIALIYEGGGNAILGTNALVALAYAVIPESQLTDEDRFFRERFGRSILSFLIKDKPGLFYANFSDALQGIEPLEQPLYSPGEAMLTLVRLFEATGDPMWWDAAKELAPGQKELWVNAGTAQVGSYAWVGQAFARMARIEQDPALRQEYTGVAYSHADAVIQHQHTTETADFFDYVGAADNAKPPRTTPTSARTESLAENYLLAKFEGDGQTMIRYGRAVLAALGFVIQSQYTHDNGYYLPRIDRAVGGIRGGLVAGDIRIDYNLHTLTGMLNARTIFDDLEALESGTFRSSSESR